MEITALTKEQLKIMRTADRVYVHASQKTSEAIISLLRTVDLDGYETEGKRTIETQAVWTLYNTPGREDYFHRAYFSISTPRYSGSWQALLYILKPGDILSLHIIAGNNSPLIDDASLYHDYLQASIWRRDKVIISGMYLTDSLCLDNSARAVQLCEKR